MSETNKNIYLDENGSFKKGNPGKKKKKRTLKTAFEKALAIIQKKQKKKFFEHVIDRAYTDDKIMMKVLDKMIADKKENTDLNLNGNLVVQYGEGAKLRK